MTRPSASDLTACFQDTLYFALGSELTLETEEAAQSSTVYREGFVSAKLHALSNTEIRVEEGASFSAAKPYAGNSRTAVLNFANPHFPGGGVAKGAIAQEECLCRSSNLYPCLNREPVLTDFYRYHREKTDYFFSDRLIYTRNVTIFKDDSLLPRKLPREDWFRLDVITCAAPFLAQRKYTNPTVLKQTFKSRIRNILEAAIDNGVEVLVLGAFGCGAFRNPPEVVAAAFREVLQEGRYHAAFQKVVFAIKRSVQEGKVCPNLAAFEKEFNPVSRTQGQFDVPSVDGVSAVTLPGGRVLESRTEINAYHAWCRNNPYFGKQFSILGDSISTLDGFNPKGYHVFYQNQTCERTGVREMEDTWWGKVIDFFGGELLVNNAWAGSRVAAQQTEGDPFPAGCSPRRTGALHVGSVTPDVILVYMGINDWANGVPEKAETGVLSNSKFHIAYHEMLRQLRTNYPNAEVWCCTLSETYMESNRAFTFPSAYGGIELREINQIIKESAERKGCRCLDLYRLREPYDAIDGMHPTRKGMDILAGAVLAALNDGDILTLLGREAEGKTEPIPAINRNQEETVTLNLWLKAEERAVQFQGERLFVGRSTDCDLRLNSAYAARYQATIIRQGKSWFLRDNNSRNGTYVNGIRLEPGELVMLKQGDSISFARKEEATVM